MTGLLRTIVILVLANATGIAVAALYLGPGFRITVAAFVVAVLIFTAVEAAAKPLLEQISKRWLPQVLGALSLIAVFVSLIVTNWLVPDKIISGIGNRVAGTLIVWLFSFLAQLVLTKWVFPDPTGTEGKGR